jgi:GTP-binding protein EngB required for normal cell division
MTKNEYTVAVKVHEDYLDTEKDIHYSTVVIVEAEDMEEAEEKVLDWFERSDIEGFVIHKVEIVKVLPKIH